MSIVELDGGDAKKMLDDLQDAKGLAAEVANGGAPSMDEAHDLARRLGRSKDLLARAMVAEKMSGEGEEENWWRECHDCGEVMRVYESDPPTCGACDSDNVTDDPYRGCAPVHADEPVSREGDREREVGRLMIEALDFMDEPTLQDFVERLARELTPDPSRMTENVGLVMGLDRFKQAVRKAERLTHADARSEGPERPYGYLSDDAVGQGIQHQYNEDDAIGSVTELALEAARRLREDEGGEKGE